LAEFIDKNLDRVIIIKTVFESEVRGMLFSCFWCFWYTYG